MFIKYTLQWLWKCSTIYMYMLIMLMEICEVYMTMNIVYVKDYLTLTLSIRLLDLDITADILNSYHNEQD